RFRPPRPSVTVGGFSSHHTAERRAMGRRNLPANAALRATHPGVDHADSRDRHSAAFTSAVKPARSRAMSRSPFASAVRNPGEKRSRTAEMPSLGKLWPVWAVLVAWVWIAFSPVLSNGFVDWDDPDWILENRSFRGLGWEQIEFAFTTFKGGVYQPL